MIPKSGDLKNTALLLQNELRRMKYPKDVCYEDIIVGHCEPLLPILHFALLDYCGDVAKSIVEMGIILTVASDQKFVENVYKVSRLLFDFKTISLSVPQFLQRGFAAEHKILFCLNILKAVQQRSRSTKSKVPKSATPSVYRQSVHVTAKTPASTTDVKKESFVSSKSPLIVHQNEQPCSDSRNDDAGLADQRILTVMHRVENLASRLEEVANRIDKLTIKADKIQAVLDVENIKPQIEVFAQRLENIERILQSKSLMSDGVALMRPSPQAVPDKSAFMNLKTMNMSYSSKLSSN